MTRYPRCPSFKLSIPLHPSPVFGQLHSASDLLAPAATFLLPQNFQFFIPQNAPGSLSYKHNCNVHSTLQSGTFHFYMSPYLPHIHCEKGALEHAARVTPDLQLLHAPESEGVETPGPHNKPITLHKVYDDKKLCLFPTQLWGQMRRTTQRGPRTLLTRLCKALSPFQLRVWGFCLALVIPGGSKQPAKNSSRTKRQEETAERRLTAEPPELSLMTQS